jgi:hypothetical protein
VLEAFNKIRHLICLYHCIRHLTLKINKMKKLVFLLAVTFAIGTVSFAQDDKKDVSKKTTTVADKVHNTLHRDKHYSGTKTKHLHKKHGMLHMNHGTVTETKTK